MSFGDPYCLWEKVDLGPIAYYRNTPYIDLSYKRFSASLLQPSLLNCNTLPSRSQRSSLYDDGIASGSRRYSSSSSKPPSEYSCYLGSGSRASSRASSARASPVNSEPPGSTVFRRGSACGSVSTLSHVDDVPPVFGVEERPEKDFSEKGSRPVSSLSAATLASLGGTSSRRGSGDTSISVDTEASIREIKEISELKDQIEDVEGRYMQGLKEMKDSLAEVEEKYKRSMVTNAQLDNEKTSLQYQVDTLRDVLLELEEELAESRRQHEEKNKECERQKHEHNVLRFQLAELKDALEQREQLLTKHGIALDSEDTPNGDASIEPHIVEECHMESPQKATALDIRLKKLLDERETFLDQIKRLKGQLEERNQRNRSPENSESDDMENGSDLQRDANRQISDLKFKLTKSTQEVTALEQNIIRLESQLTRYKTLSENAEKTEDELKAEKRRLQRELRTALDKVEELEVGNSHLVKRLEKMKANRSAILSHQ
uniref:Leucine rich repeat (in FLII) interacting protein 1 n=1 Tax=Xenopus tropicalis TaxID=8364 RepID=A0A6I8SMM5_XENTR